MQRGPALPLRDVVFQLRWLLLHWRQLPENPKAQQQPGIVSQTGLRVQMHQRSGRQQVERMYALNRVQLSAI